MVWRVLLINLFLSSFRWCSKAATTTSATLKIGFVFMFHRQKDYSTLQQLAVWEQFFASATNNRSVVAFVNYADNKLPKFVDASFTKPKAQQGGPGYLQAFLRVSKYLIDEYEVSGVLLLSGGTIPIRCFDNVYSRIEPFLQKGSSILAEYITTDPVHVQRYYQIQKPAVTIDAWGIHPSSGYCAHSSLITLAINTWEKNAHDLKHIDAFDEHILSYTIRGALNPDTGHSRSSLRIYQELDKRSLLFIDWTRKNADGTAPYVWKQQLTNNEIESLRQNDYYFIEKVASTCALDLPFVLKCG